MDTPIAEAQREAETQKERGKVKNSIGLQNKYNEDTQKLMRIVKIGYLKDKILGFKDPTDLKNFISLIESNQDEIKKEVKLKGPIQSSSLYESGLIQVWRDEYQKETPADDEYDHWLDEKINARLSSFRQQIILFESSTFLPPIIWAMPTKDSKNDTFIYSGKTIEKTVHIPFRKIHEHLLKSNWAMREINYNITSSEASIKNYLLAHLLFITSDRPYKKNMEGKYIGGRTFVDFPITVPLNILRVFKDSDKYNNLGKYISNGHNSHAEGALIKHLQNETANIVSILKSKFILLGDGDFQKFKIYSVNLFLNSVHNICREGENDLANLMNSQEQGSFLNKLKTQLQQEMLNAVLPKSGNLLMLITISCHQEKPNMKDYSDSVMEDAKNALGKGFRYMGYYDTKQLVGKTILSTSELWIDWKSQEEHRNDALEALKTKDFKIPSYTGFVSGNKEAQAIRAEPNQYRRRIAWHNIRNHDTPKFFDNLDISKGASLKRPFEAMISNRGGDSIRISSG